MSGFTLAAAAARIRSIDSTVQWKAYTALTTLARLRGTKKSALETLVFGKDKPSKDFSNAWTRGGKLFAAGMSPTQKQAITVMPIEEAQTAMLQALDAHMVALDVHGKNAYDAKAEYANKAEADAANADNEPEEAPAPADADAPEAPTAAEPTTPNGGKLSFADVCAIVSDWSDTDKEALVAFLLAKPTELAVAA